MLQPSRQATEFKRRAGNLVDSGQQAGGESIRVMEPTGSKAYIHNRTGVFCRVSNREIMTGGKLALALAAAAMVLTPAISLAAPGKQRPPAISLSFDKISGFAP